MKEKVRFLGLDVHAETIAVAIAEPDGEVRSLGTSRRELFLDEMERIVPWAELSALALSLIHI